MKTDLDRLMAEANLNAIVILGDSKPNTYRDYLTNRSKASGSLIKKRGEPAVFIVQSGMELAEAEKSGLKVYRLFDFRQADLLKKHGGAVDLVARDLICNMLRQFEITGRVAFYGTMDVQDALVRLAGLPDCLPDLEPVVGGAAATLFGQAFSTKDANELAHLKEAGRLTSQVVRETWDMISQHRSRDNIVVDKDGKPLTIGAVKKFIQICELQLDLEPKDCIFAQGRDAGIPHSHGTDTDVLRLGTTIVFDITPRHVETGYYHDLTRTWCISYAPDEAQALYDDVLHAFHSTKQAFKVGQPGADYQKLVCDYFESKGYPTPRSHPGTLDGYVHGVGHGIGLNIHEAPSFQLESTNALQAGSVFTVEPGLYYPDRGLGIRIEDTVCLDENGVLQNFSDVPYDLVLPLKG
jgi:Xaa-Pro aminopeptidase